MPQKSSSPGRSGSRMIVLDSSKNKKWLDKLVGHEARQQRGSYLNSFFVSGSICQSKTLTGVVKLTSYQVNESE